MGLCTRQQAPLGQFRSESRSCVCLLIDALVQRGSHKINVEVYSRAFLENPRFKFFMAASEPAMVSRIFSPAAAALDRAAAVLPPNLGRKSNHASSSCKGSLTTCYKAPDTPMHTSRHAVPRREAESKVRTQRQTSRKMSCSSKTPSPKPGNEFLRGGGRRAAACGGRSRRRRRSRICRRSRRRWQWGRGRRKNRGGCRGHSGVCGCWRGHGHRRRRRRRWRGRRARRGRTRVRGGRPLAADALVEGVHRRLLLVAPHDLPTHSHHSDPSCSMTAQLSACTPAETLPHQPHANATHCFCSHHCGNSLRQSRAA